MTQKPNTTHIKQIGFTYWLQVGKPSPKKCFQVINEYIVLGWGYTLKEVEKKGKKALVKVYNKERIEVFNTNQQTIFQTDLRKFKFFSGLNHCILIKS